MAELTLAWTPLAIVDDITAEWNTFKSHRKSKYDFYKILSVINTTGFYRYKDFSKEYAPFFRRSKERFYRITYQPDEYLISNEDIVPPSRDGKQILADLKILSLDLLGYDYFSVFASVCQAKDNGPLLEIVFIN